MFDRYHMIQKARAEGNEGGFTLIELLIVIVVLGILAGVTVFALGSVTSQSAQSACKADAKSVEVGVEAFKAQTGLYPAAIGDLVPNYVRTAPSSAKYAVTVVAATGEVDVAVTGPPAFAATNFDAGNGAICNNVK